MDGDSSDCISTEVAGVQPDVVSHRATASLGTVRQMTAPNPANEFIPTRYSLLSRLHDWDDQESWRQFFDTYWQLIYRSAMKAGLSESEAQDVVQETVITVAKDIEKFKRDRKLGSFKGWLGNIVRWRVADQLRARGPKRDAADQDAMAPASVEDAQADSPMESAWDKEWQENLLAVAISRVKREVKEEHFQIFDLLVLQETPVPEVVKRLGVGRGRLYLIKHRISKLIQQHLRDLEKTPI